MHTRPDDQYIGLSRTDGSIRETNISPFRDTFPCSRRKTPSKSIYLTLLSFSESSTPLTHEMPTKNFTKRRGQHYGMIMCTTIHSTQLECTTLRLGWELGNIFILLTKAMYIPQLGKQKLKPKMLHL